MAAPTPEVVDEVHAPSSDTARAHARGHMQIRKNLAARPVSEAWKQLWDSWG